MQYFVLLKFVEYCLSNFLAGMERSSTCKQSECLGCPRHVVGLVPFRISRVNVCDEKERRREREREKNWMANKRVCQLFHSIFHQVIPYCVR